MMKDKTVGVFFGSRSPEHDVSIITAQLIISGLKGSGYEVVPVYITKKGGWLIDERLGELKTFTDLARTLDVSKYRSYYLDLEKSHGRIVFKKKGLDGKEIVIDLAFPALHGSYGEDGTIQGLFEMIGVPYVGCGVAASALAMDKILTKLFYLANKIPTPQFLHFSREEWTAGQEKILKEISEGLRWPMFVKPASLGSSIGIKKVKSERELQFGIEVALHYDNKFLVEESVENLMDVTCCVIGNENPTASLLQESVFTGSEYFSYEEKYLKEGGTQFGKAASNVVIPARLDQKTTREIREMAVNIYKIFGCSGIARVDFLYDKSARKVYVNEINPLPGTLYHHLWKASGIALSELLENLLELALQKHESKKKFTQTFETEILRKAGQAKLRFKK